MRPVAIVVSGEFGQHRMHVALIDHDQMIEALGTNRPDDPFGAGVGRLRIPSKPRGGATLGAWRRRSRRRHQQQL